jgi:hypothetical protein
MVGRELHHLGAADVVTLLVMLGRHVVHPHLQSVNAVRAEVRSFQRNT